MAKAWMIDLVKTLALALGLAVLAALVWWAWGGSERADDSLRPALPVRALTATEDLRMPVTPDIHERDQVVATTSVLISSDETVVERAAGTVDLLAIFVNPDGDELVVPQAAVTLRGAQGSLRTGFASGESMFWVESLQPDLYTIRVDAEGFDHREQFLDLSDPGAASEEIEIILWPADRVAILVLTSDGGILQDLADEFGIDGEQIFVDAFAVRTRIDAPDAEAWTDAGPQPAVFQKPPGYKNWQLPGSSIGSLQLLDDPPFWVGLSIFGIPHGWELLPPRAREVVFTLDADAFAERFARVSLRVVDDTSGSGAADARVTLIADTSAYRRSDHHDVIPSGGGSIVLERVIPDVYELAITRGDAFYQDRFALAPGEERDLGEIALGTGQRIELRVVDEHGKPAQTWIEIGPYRPGERADDLYPSLSSRGTGPDGVTELALPAKRSIIRATVVEEGNYGMYSTDVRSANVLLDPEQLLPGPLVLVVHEPTEVALEIQASGAHTLELVDGLDLIVATMSGEIELCTMRLCPGSYCARLVASSGEVLTQKRFDVREEPVRVAAVAPAITPRPRPSSRARSPRAARRANLHAVARGGRSRRRRARRRAASRAHRRS